MKKVFSKILCVVLSALLIINTTLIGQSKAWAGNIENIEFASNVASQVLMPLSSDTEIDKYVNLKYADKVKKLSQDKGILSKENNVYRIYDFYNDNATYSLYKKIVPSNKIAFVAGDKIINQETTFDLKCPNLDISQDDKKAEFNYNDLIYIGLVKRLSSFVYLWNGILKTKETQSNKNIVDDNKIRNIFSRLSEEDQRFIPVKSNSLNIEDNTGHLSFIGDQDSVINQLRNSQGSNELGPVDLAENNISNAYNDLNKTIENNSKDIKLIDLDLNKQNKAAQDAQKGSNETISFFKSIIAWSFLSIAIGSFIMDLINVFNQPSKEYQKQIIKSLNWIKDEDTNEIIANVCQADGFDNGITLKCEFDNGKTVIASEHNSLWFDTKIKVKVPKDCNCLKSIVICSTPDNLDKYVNFQDTNNKFDIDRFLLTKNKIASMKFLDNVYQLINKEAFDWEYSNYSFLIDESIHNNIEQALYIARFFYKTRLFNDTRYNL